MVCWLYIIFKNTANNISLWEITFLMKVSRKWEEQDDKQVKIVGVLSALTSHPVVRKLVWSVVVVSIVFVFKGGTHSEDVVKSGQEDCASPGVEENSSGPQSHSWTSAAGRRDSSGSSGPGKRVHW